MKRLMNLAFFCLLITALMVSGCSWTGSKKGPDNQVPQQGQEQKPGTKPEGQNDSGQPAEPAAPEKVEVTLFFGDDQAMYLKPETRKVTQDGLTMGQLLIRELTLGPQTKGLSKTIPPEARLLSLKVENGVAYADFSKEMRTKHWGGSAGERMTVQSIVHTLTGLSEIKKVQFLIEGKKEEAIWGHGDTTQPIGPEPNIVKE